MRILQVSYTDVLGERFNGHALARHFRSLGHESSQAVWKKEGSDSLSWSISSTFVGGISKYLIRRIERRLSLQSALYPSPLGLLMSGGFQRAQVVHYQLIHLDFFNLLFLPFLTHLKPSIWTLHDMWPMTGHCVHPYSCSRWLTGCARCDWLDLPLAMRGQGTARMYALKRLAYRHSSLDLMVFSTWLLERVRQSPLMSDFPIHLVPPGLDTATFSPGDKSEARQRLGIPDGKPVISFRSASVVFKGLPYIKEALRALNRPGIHLLTCGEVGNLEEFKANYSITELGSLNDSSHMADFYRASDIFLMPSTAESFGMMAAEAVSCGTPCIVFDGTPLPETSFALQGASLAVPQGDSAALAQAVGTLINDPARRCSMGTLGRELAVARYDFAVHADSIMRIYEGILARQKGSHA